METYRFDKTPTEYRKSLEKDPNYQITPVTNAIPIGIKWGSVLGVCLGGVALIVSLVGYRDLATAMQMAILIMISGFISGFIISFLIARYRKTNSVLNEDKVEKDATEYLLHFFAEVRQNSDQFENSAYTKEIVKQFVQFFKEQIYRTPRNQTIKDIKKHFCVAVYETKASICETSFPIYTCNLNGSVQNNYDFSSHRVKNLESATDRAALLLAIEKLMKQAIEQDWPPHKGDANASVTSNIHWDKSPIYCELVYQANNKSFVSVSQW